MRAVTKMESLFKCKCKLRRLRHLWRLVGSLPPPLPWEWGVGFLIGSGVDANCKPAVPSPRSLESGGRFS